MIKLTSKSLRSWHLLVAALALWSAFKAYTGITLEDALITFRFAENIALGHGYVYTIGERVQGTTTPLLTLTLGLAGRILGVGSIPWVATLLMISAGLGMAWLTASLLYRACNSQSMAWLGMAFVLFNRDSIWATTGGMETPLVLFWMALSLWALVANRIPWAVIGTAGLMLTRIDGVVWASMIWLILLIRLRLHIWRPAVVFFLLVLPWYIWATWYFGHPLPHSMLAKQSHTALHAIFEPAYLSQFLRWYSRPLGLGVPVISGPALLIFLGRLALVVTGTVWLLQQRKPQRIILWTLPGFLLLFGAAMFVGRAPTPFPWYLLPPAWAALILGAVGMNRLWSAPLLQQRPTWLLRSWRTGLLALTLGIESLLIMQSFAYHQRFQQNEDGLRKEIGLWIRMNTPPQSSVAMEAIGYQGVYARRRIIDLDALVSPDVLRLREQADSHAEAFYLILSELRPDYLILRSSEIEQNQHFHGGPLFKQDRQKQYFMDHYAFVREWTAPHPELWGEGGRLSLFERVRTYPTPDRIGING